MTDVDGGIANLKPLEQAREQKAWYWYDWANSAYTTTIGTVFFGPYFINLAENAVGGEDGRFEVAGLSLAAGLALLLADHGLHDPVRADPAAAGGVRRPGGEQEAAAGDPGLDRLVLRRTHLLRHRRQLAARRRGHRAGQPVLRRGRRGQRLDPAAHLRRGRPGPGLLARLGVRLPRRRPPAGAQPGRLPRPRGPRARRGARRPPVHALGRRVVGRLHLHPLPPAQRPPAGGRRAGRGQRDPRAASASSPPPCATCASTRWR